ncbi:hypothetical protein [Treponema endosymbiont of Eucomonympha sp.]|uniref:hypothetical protein n=1 Tax=Treponema endosymbiont of Eucomonympha sp. TaxID=1580831 RepID=UPI0007856243|nr:hypothetical protein [Treponema endosymbiont of Eucomonympha sp.]
MGKRVLAGLFCALFASKAPAAIAEFFVAAPIVSETAQGGELTRVVLLGYGAGTLSLGEDGGLGFTVSGTVWYPAGTARSRADAAPDSITAPYLFPFGMSVSLGYSVEALVLAAVSFPAALTLHSSSALHADEATSDIGIASTFGVQVPLRECSLFARAEFFWDVYKIALRYDGFSLSRTYTNIYGVTPQIGVSYAL